MDQLLNFVIFEDFLILKVLKNFDQRNLGADLLPGRKQKPDGSDPNLMTVIPFILDQSKGDINWATMERAVIATQHIRHMLPLFVEKVVPVLGDISAADSVIIGKIGKIVAGSAHIIEIQGITQQGQKCSLPSAPVMLLDLAAHSLCPGDPSSMVGFESQITAATSNLRFQINAAGSYQLDIRIGDTSIKGFPCPVQVVASAPKIDLFELDTHAHVADAKIMIAQMQEASFYVDCKDAFGNLIRTKEPPMQLPEKLDPSNIRLINAAGQRAGVAVSQWISSAGRYEINMMPMQLGVLQLAITLCGIHIYGSPFSIHVVEQVAQEAVSVLGKRQREF